MAPIRQISRVLGVSLLVCLLSGGVEAQNTVSGLADATRIHKSFFEEPKPLSKPSEQHDRGDLQVDYPPGAEDIVVHLEGLTIEGATIYSQGELRMLYESLLGQSITVAKLFHVAAAISEKYKNDGYIFTKTFLPPQKIEKGLAVIKVVEGKFNDVHVEGAQMPDRLIQKIRDRILGMRGINIHELETHLLLLNDLPGISASSVIKPAENEEEGALILHLVFEEERFIASTSFDNFGSRLVGPYLAGAHIGINHPYLYFQQTRASFVMALPPSELKYIEASHTVPMLSGGMTLDLSANLAFLKPGERLADNKLKGSAKNYSVSVRYPWVRSREKNFITEFKLAFKDSDSTVQGTRLSSDRLYVASVGLIFDFIGNYGGINIAGIKLSQGLDMLSVRKTGSTDLSRQEGRSDFTKVEASIARLQRVNDWLNVQGIVKGQYAANPLLSVEEFGYGGRDIGRGYNASEIVGDHGLSALLEFRYVGEQPFLGVAIQPYAFYDIGKVWNIDNKNPENFSGSSTGFGIRINTVAHFSFNGAIVQPLTRSIETPQWGNGRNAQIKFSLAYRF